MKRSPLSVADIADMHTLAAAFHAAAKGKRARGDVEAFRANLDRELLDIRTALLNGTIELGRMRCFHIRDPKPRIIHAPCFQERVLHHAIMAHAGPVLDRVLVDDSYACRAGKGTLAAVQRVQHHAERHAWYAQIDIKSYFASIDHGILLSQLGRLFKNAGLLSLFADIIGSFHSTPGKGLPIGTLTSQYFANFHLAAADRIVLEQSGADGFVRYMDDLIWWGADRESVRATLAVVRNDLQTRLGLAVKQPVRVGRSRDGIAFCGYRILPGRLLLSRRRKRRYRELRAAAETAWCAGEIDDAGLQRAYGSALALTAHTQAVGWRRGELRLNPLAAELSDAYEY